MYVTDTVNWFECKSTCCVPPNLPTDYCS